MWKSQARSLPTSYIPPENTEDDRVFLWQVEMMLGLGFAADEAELLAMSGAEHWDVKALLDRGCPPHLVLRLL